MSVLTKAELKKQVMDPRDWPRVLQFWDEGRFTWLEAEGFINRTQLRALRTAAHHPYRNVGNNADWSEPAYLIGPDDARANVTSGAIYVVESYDTPDEFEVVQRWHSDDLVNPEGLLYKPSAEVLDMWDGDNDVVDGLAGGLTLPEAISLAKKEAAKLKARKNPRKPKSPRRW